MSRILLCLCACLVLTSATYMSGYQTYNDYYPGYTGGYYNNYNQYPTGFPVGHDYPAMNMHVGHTRYRRSVYSYPTYRRYGSGFGGRVVRDWGQSAFRPQFGQFGNGFWNNGRFNRQFINRQLY